MSSAESIASAYRGGSEDVAGPFTYERLVEYLATSPTDAISAIGENSIFSYPHNPVRGGYPIEYWSSETSIGLIEYSTLPTSEDLDLNEDLDPLLCVGGDIATRRYDSLVVGPQPISVALPRFEPGMRREAATVFDWVSRRLAEGGNSPAILERGDYVAVFDNGVLHDLENWPAFENRRRPLPTFFGELVQFARLTSLYELWAFIDLPGAESIEKIWRQGLYAESGCSILVFADWDYEQLTGRDRDLFLP